jgi:hypothetical protein
MPGPRDRVVIDPDRLRVVVGLLHTLRDLLFRWRRSLTALSVPLGEPAGVTRVLRRSADWADTEAGALARRVALAEAADDAGAATADGDQRGAGTGTRAAGHRLVLVGRPDPYRDAAAARTAGVELAGRLAGAFAGRVPDAATAGDVAVLLRAAALDPDVVSGFFDALGPGRLAGLLHRLADLAAEPDRRRRATTAAPWGTLTAALGAALATHSRTGALDDRWLGRFNILRRDNAAETSLLAPLLAAGRFDPALLGRLGAALFEETELRGGGHRAGPVPIPAAGADVGPAPDRGAASAARDSDGSDGGDGSDGPDGADGGAAHGVDGVDDPRDVREVRDVGLFGLANPDGRLSRPGYAVALLRAIADEPRLAASFATDHVVTMIRGSQLAVRLPGVGVDAQTMRAWAYLISRAGGAAARRADPRAAATFVARLAFTVHRDVPPPVPPAIRAAFGDVLHVWRDEMYASVVDLLPAAAALRARPDAAGPGPVQPPHGDPAGAEGLDTPAGLDGRVPRGGLGLVDEWPPDGPWSTGAPGPADAARIPAELWAALLREALAGGAGAGELALDAVTVAADREQAEWSRTRGYRIDPAVAYPASPRALGHLRLSALRSFFTATLADAADGLADAATRQASEDARRAALVIELLADVAKAIDVGDGARTAANIVVGVTVDSLAAAARQATRAVPAPATLARIAGLRAYATVFPGWQDAYRSSAVAVWTRRDDDPIAPVEVTDATGRRRRYTGDPRTDGFVTGPATDFLDRTGVPIDPALMTAAQRAAYVDWLASPAIVANNDNIPTSAGMQSQAGTGAGPDLGAAAGAGGTTSARRDEPTGSSTGSAGATGRAAATP